MQSNPSTETLPDFLYADALRTSGIYSITCLVNGRSYIGSAVNISLRWRAHYRQLLNGKHHNAMLRNAWNKYGCESFRFSVLELVSVDQLIEREQYHIDAADKHSMFNLSPSAGSLRGFQQSPEVRELMRVQRAGIATHTEESKLRMRLSKLGKVSRPAGWKMTDQQKDKLRQAHLGKLLSSEHKEKVSIALLGRKLSDDARKNIGLGKARSSKEQVGAIRHKYQTDEVSIGSLASAFGLGRDVIRRILHGTFPYDYNPPLQIRTAFKASLDTRAKLSASLKGKPKPEGFRLKLLGNQNAKGRNNAQEG